MVTPLAVSLVFLACASHHAPTRGRGMTEGGRVGVTVRALPEGLLVEQLAPGGAAERAGLGPGDLIVTVDDIEVRRAPRAAAAALRGPPGSVARLTVREAEGGDFREVEAQRGAPTAAQALPQVPPSVRGMRRALASRGPRAARRATEAALADDFGGLPPAEAVGAGLAVAWRRRPAVALAAGRVLAEARLGDARLDARLGRLFVAAQAWSEAAAVLSAAEAARPPDVWDPAGGFRGEAGGGLDLRLGLARSLWATERRDAAIDIVEALLASHDDPHIAAEVGMAPWRRTEPWRASLPPVDDFSVDLLSGGRWTLSEHRGDLVVLSFFATWCAPCRRELPALASLAEQHRGQGVEVLGLSLDDRTDAAALPAFVAGLGLDIPVAHAPALAARFGVTGIPALRVIDGQGVLIHAATGYSAATLPTLATLLDTAASDGSLPGSVLGPAWTRGRASLEGFLALPGAVDVALTEEALVLSRGGMPPVTLLGGGPVTDPTVEGPGGGDRVAWLSGPITALAGGRWVRATTTSGRPRWLLTTRAPVTALDADADHVWVGTADATLLVDALGRVAARVDGPVSDLAADGRGGAWLVDGEELRHVDLHGEVDLRRPAARAAIVDGTGRVASADFEDLRTGRFGPGGAPRSAVARRDGTLVVLDGDGAPAMTWSLHDPPRLAVGDLDGDGQDELLLSIRGQGLATVRLQIP